MSSTTDCRRPTADDLIVPDDDNGEFDGFVEYNVDGISDRKIDATLREFYSGNQIRVNNTDSRDAEAQDEETGESQERTPSPLDGAETSTDTDDAGDDEEEVEMDTEEEESAQENLDEWFQ